MDGAGVKEVAALQEKIAQTIVVGDKTYSTVGYSEVKPREPKDQPIEFAAPPTLIVTTLSGLIDYLVANPDGVSAGAEFGRVRKIQQERPKGARIIHIVSPTRVDVLSAYQDDDANSRFCFVRASIPDRPISFGTAVDRETFQIGLQIGFADDGDRAKVLMLVGNLVDEQKVGQKDNGVTQTATVRVGVMHAENFEVPNPVFLAPYRSFPEIEPPLSPFVLRINPGLKVALHETAPGVWAVDTATKIQEYLQSKLYNTVAESLLILR